MKKLYQESKYLEYSERKSRRILKKRRKKNRRVAHTTSRVHRFREALRPDEQRLTAPSIFDFLENPDETIRFFDEFYKLVRQRKPIFLDISEVESLAPNALLYILSRFKKWSSRGRLFKVSGNEPKNSTCKRMLRQSGFYRYITSHSCPEDDSQDVLKIEEGSMVDGALADRVLSLRKPTSESDNGRFHSRNYASIIELMGNTREHANPESDIKHYHWHLMAVVDREKKRLRVSFLDNGAGIPATIRMKKLERVGGLLDRIFSDTPSVEARLIVSALHGEFRSRTEEAHRGKGLPKIYRAYNEKYLHNLVIVSNKAYLNLDKNDFHDLGQKFYGTLFCWNIPIQ